MEQRRREAVQQISRDRANHDRQAGKLPDSRKIEQHYQRIAERHERENK